jgi:hypothetical protein
MRRKRTRNPRRRKRNVTGHRDRSIGGATQARSDFSRKEFAHVRGEGKFRFSPHTRSLIAFWVSLSVCQPSSSAPRMLAEAEGVKRLFGEALATRTPMSVTAERAITQVPPPTDGCQMIRLMCQSVAVFLRNCSLIA